MATAIISDIHANLEAFESVLKDIKHQGISDIICLGDVIGYGPNPRECLKLVRGFKTALRGNHEEAVLFISIDFREDAAVAVDWTRAMINSTDYDKTESHFFWDWLGDLPRLDELDDKLFVHGTPREPTREYLRAADVVNREKMTENFDLIRHVCFCGHTHEPGVFTEEPDGQKKYYSLKELNNVYHIDSRKCLINVGSVGQPRDGDNRACYVTLDDNSVTYHRVPYDYKLTMKKIMDTKTLPPVLANRLELGR